VLGQLVQQVRQAIMVTEGVMDYSKLSDFEINKLVAESSSVDSCVRVNFSGDAIGGSAEKWLCRNEGLTKFDPCNNSADAWPIITEHMIAIIPSNLKDGRWAAHINEWDFAASHENPLRAAMTAFLKMQEAANVPANSTGPDIR
jgi:hypothetical protein